MGVTLLSMVLLAAAPPAMPDPQSAAPVEAAHDRDAGHEMGGTPVPGCRPSVAIWRATTTWLMPVVRKSYAPGTLPSPSGSWYKHPYLAYRGNYYTAGYDFRREFDYPWHTARTCHVPRLGEPSGVPLDGEASAPTSAPRRAASESARPTRGASAAAKR